MFKKKISPQIFLQVDFYSEFGRKSCTKKKNSFLKMFEDLGEVESGALNLILVTLEAWLSVVL